MVKKFKKYYQEISEKFDALNIRERALIAVIPFVLVITVWDSVFIQPVMENKKNIGVETKRLQTLIDANQPLKERLVDQLQQDPNTREQIKLDRLNTNIMQLDTELKMMTVELITPQQMVKVLEDIMNKQPGLKLISLKTMAATPVMKSELMSENDEVSDENEESDETTQVAQEELPKVYKHGLEMTFKGDYFTVLSYVQKLEDLSWNFLWNAIEIKMNDYPVAEVTIRVDTLSLAEGWIGV